MPKNFQICSVKNIFSPFVSLMLMLWSYIIFTPTMKVISIYKDWIEGYGQTTPTNTNTYDRHDPFAAFFDETDNFQVP